MAKSGKGGWRGYSSGRQSRDANWRPMKKDGGPIAVNADAANENARGAKRGGKLMPNREAKG